ncbi:MAG: FkbM family methyltransferase [Planctomycetes bacterium]|nr:FkbM family methyltransferase [Planctomycetota bacterium]
MLGRIKRALLKLMPTSLAGRLRAWRIRHLIRQFPTRVVEHTYGNCILKVYLADPLSQGWYDQDWSELPEIAVLRQTRLRPGARVFDIGAHQGVVALMLAREVGSHGQVVAVEPSPHNISAAVKNRELNGMPQIEVLQAAVSDRRGKLMFNEGLNGQLDDGTGSWGKFEVESMTIDDLADRFGLPDVVFVDVEGAECMALAGASRVLSSGADFFVEVHVNCGLEKLGGTVDQVLSYFPEERFTIVGRKEEDTEFRPLLKTDPLTNDRFFLIARVK